MRKWVLWKRKTYPKRSSKPYWRSKEIKDLQYLKEQVPQGSGEEVENLTEDKTILEEEKKEECLYREVKFVKTSATCINKPSAIIQILKNYKLL